MRTCSIETCDLKRFAGDYCRMHYYSWKTYGDPAVRKYAPRGEPERFLRAALSHTSPECLIWPYAKSHGYPVAVVDGESVRGTRWICTQRHGPAPTDEHEAAHNCGKGHLGCISPLHLRWDTHKGNCADRITHGTQARGDQCSWSKITEADADFIREAAGKINQHDLAERFGVTQAHISNLQRGKRRHAKGAAIEIPGVEIIEERVL